MVRIAVIIAMHALLFFNPAAFAVPAVSGEGETAGVPSTAPARGPGLLDANLDDVPTYIKSKSLTLKQGERFFVYNGGVETKHGDMTITSDTLEGRYGEKNDIEQLVALNNVVIVRESGLRATSEKAVYDKKTRTLVLTENPELQQQGSILTADAITIYLDEDRSVADGEVRVKLVQKDDGGVKLPGS